MHPEVRRALDWLCNESLIEKVSQASCAPNHIVSVWDMAGHKVDVHLVSLLAELEARQQEDELLASSMD